MKSIQVKYPKCGRILIMDKECIAPFVVKLDNELQCSICKKPILLEEIYSGILQR